METQQQAVPVLDSHKAGHKLPGGALDMPHKQHMGDVGLEGDTSAG